MIGWFPLAIFKFLFLPWLLTVWFWCVSWIFEFIPPGLLSILNGRLCFPSNLGLLSHYFFKCSFLFSFSFWNSNYVYVGTLTVSHTNLWPFCPFSLLPFSLYVPKTGYLQLTSLEFASQLFLLFARLLLSSPSEFSISTSSFYLVLYMCICVYDISIFLLIFSGDI